MDREGSRVAAREFGVPAGLVDPVALLLPLAELAVAVLVLLTPTARIGGIGALALLAIFIAAIAANLALGRQPDCHCFGQLHSAPAGPATLARNGALAALAGLVVWRGAGAGAPAIGRWLDHLGGVGWVVLVGGVLGALVTIAMLRMLLQLMQQNGRLLSAFDHLESRLKTVEERLGIDAPLLSEGVVPGGLSVGERAPTFTLPTLEGEPATLDLLRAAGKPVLLLFTDPGCGPCTTLLPDVSRWQQVHAPHATFVLVSRGGEQANRAKRTEFGVSNILLQQDREVAESYRVAGTPSGVVVRPDGTVGSHIAVGADGIRQLVTSLVGSAGPSGNGHVPDPAAPPFAVPVAVPIGEPAPQVAISDLDGDPFDLSDYEGEATAVLFWNPQCGFCRQMLDDLKAWEQAPPEGAPKLVLVSSGSSETNRDMGLRAPIGLDDAFEVGRSFGAAGTPSAVLVDAEGRVASSVVVGAVEVLGLLAKSQAPSEAAPA
jgi:peroxiredoxin